MTENLDIFEIQDVLKKSKTIAVVGISDNPERDSYRVAKYLKEKGYKIYPVNPKFTEVLGEKCYPDLSSIPDHIDIVDIFRKPEAVPGVVEEAVKIKADTVWMQLGAENDEAAKRAKEAGLKVIMHKCIKVEHQLGGMI